MVVGVVVMVVAHSSSKYEYITLIQINNINPKSFPQHNTLLFSLGLIYPRALPATFHTSRRSDLFSLTHLPNSLSRPRSLYKGTKPNPRQRSELSASSVRCGASRPSVRVRGMGWDGMPARLFEKKIPISPGIQHY